MKNKNITDSEDGTGTLYVVATPIGNLEDITARALSILKQVHTIAAESVSHTRELCTRYGISTRMTGFNQHNQKTKSEDLLRKLMDGLDIALVTNAGTPGISDPGAYLTDRVLKTGIRVVPVPGPSAVISAVSVCGFPAEGFVFAGFLPNRSSKRRQELIKLTREERTLVFLEAPHRVKAMLKDVLEVMGDRTITITREMTKVFEEIKRGTVKSMLQAIEEDAPRGEFTIVLQGAPHISCPPPEESKLLKIIDLVLNDGPMGMKDIAHQLSEITGIPFRTVYRECLAKGRQHPRD